MIKEEFKSQQLDATTSKKSYEKKILLHQQ